MFAALSAWSGSFILRFLGHDSPEPRQLVRVTGCQVRAKATVRRVGSGSMTEGWSTDRAGVSLMEDVNREAAGAVSVTVHGGNMGSTGYTARARDVGTVHCEGSGCGDGMRGD